GGPSHHDSFDPKPDAPPEVRGEFKTIPTTLPGVRFAEHLPLLARNTDKYSMPPFVQLGRAIDRRFNGGIAGFLGDEFNAFEVPDDPSRPNFSVRDLSVAE